MIPKVIKYNMLVDENNDKTKKVKKWHFKVSKTKNDNNTTNMYVRSWIAAQNQKSGQVYSLDTSPNDLGTSPNDPGNLPNDSGRLPNDSGNPPNDPGNTPNDLGDPPNDPGKPPNDLGKPPNDLGSPPK